MDGLPCPHPPASRDGIYGLQHASEWGGCSGEPLRQKSRLVLSKVHQSVKDKSPLIGIGGVNGVIAAREKMAAGAALVQLYSAFVYQGPQVIADIVDNL